jgi:hypothetical protein
METILSLLVGVGLSAACGFRVFVPLLVVSIAVHGGHLQLASGFAWMGSDIALIAFAVATALEIAAYYVPWIDNLLDSVATPAAIVAGTVVTASLVADLSPFLKWTLAAIAGGGVAGAVQGTTVLARAVSSAGTGGLANPIVSTFELGGSLLLSCLALIVPVLVAIGVVGILAVGGAGVYRRSSRTGVQNLPPPPPARA